MRNQLASALTIKKTVLITALCLTASLLLVLLSRYAEGFAQWYAVHIYHFYPDVVGKLIALWKHSVMEAGILSFLFLFLVSVFLWLFLFFIKMPWAKQYYIVSLRLTSCIVSVLILIFTLTCGINYQRDDIGTVMRLPAVDISKDKLEKLSLLLVQDLTDITLKPGWDYSVLTASDDTYIEKQAVSAMKELGKTEPTLSGYYPRPKPFYFSSVLSDLGIEGIYSPFTMEANYNNDMTQFLIPYTICHEFAHLKGYMKEDDAGFIAYLACINSPSEVFQYSGIFHALIFTLNALKTETSVEEFNEIYEKLPDPVKIQLSFIQEQNQQNSSSIMDAANSVNNMYLKANAQAGTVSYGLIVDLLIAYNEDRIDKTNLT